MSPEQELARAIRIFRRNNERNQIGLGKAMEHFADQVVANCLRSVGAKEVLRDSSGALDWDGMRRATRAPTFKIYCGIVYGRNHGFAWSAYPPAIGFQSPDTLAFSPYEAISPDAARWLLRERHQRHVLVAMCQQV